MDSEVRSKALMAYAKGSGITEVAQRFDLSVWAVRRMLREAGALRRELRRADDPNAKPYYPLPDLHVDGETLWALHEMAKASDRTVREVILSILKEVTCGD